MERHRVRKFIREWLAGAAARPAENSNPDIHGHSAEHGQGLPQLALRLKDGGRAVHHTRRQIFRRVKATAATVHGGALTTTGGKDGAAAGVVREYGFNRGLVKEDADNSDEIVAVLRDSTLAAFLTHSARAGFACPATVCRPRFA
jgi:hypothetical protein